MRNPFQLNWPTYRVFRSISASAMLWSVIAICPTSANAQLAVESEAPATPESAADKEKALTDFELMQVFVDTFHQVEQNYVKDVERRELVEAAIRGMLTELDPYSNYISPDDLSRFDEEINQEFGGIGIQVNLDPETRSIIVVSPIPGTPAYNAGIRAGDRITKIAGKKVSDFEIGNELDSAISLMRGKPGEPIEITYVPAIGDNARVPLAATKDADSTKTESEKKDDEKKAEEKPADDDHEEADPEALEPKTGPEPKTVTVKREIINVATIMGDHYNKDDSWNFFADEDKKIGYIRLTHFTQKTTQELRDALRTLKKQGMQALILDLRFNPGGLLSTATEVSDLFIESGKIVSTKGRNTKERVWTAVKPGTYSDFPMAVLVNRYSASASEIVSASLQDHKRAVVIGERTWGKGSVQNVIEMEHGHSALKLTTASYHRPSGKNIHRFPGATEQDEWGVMPDDGYIVRFSPEQIRSYLEYRRDRDILNQKDPPKSEFVDVQLDKAIEYLTEKLDEPATEKGSDKSEEDSEKKETKKEDGKKAAQLHQFHPAFTTG